MLRKKGIRFGETEFAANLPREEQDRRVQQLIDEGFPINFVQFTPGTVQPPKAEGAGSEHMYSFDHAYTTEGVRDWLFAQSR